MQVPKASDAAKARFTSLVPDDPRVVVKPMFGNLGAFVNGNMFAGLFGPSIGVKLADDERADLAAVEGAGPFGPAERPMGGYLSLPPSCTTEQAAGWVDKARTYVATLPPKARKNCLLYTSDAADD